MLYCITVLLHLCPTTPTIDTTGSTDISSIIYHQHDVNENNVEYAGGKYAY